MNIREHKPTSEVIFLIPERRFGSTGTLAEILYPYLEREVLRRLFGNSAASPIDYNQDMHETVPYQGGMLSDEVRSLRSGFNR